MLHLHSKQDEVVIPEDIAISDPSREGISEEEEEEYWSIVEEHKEELALLANMFLSGDLTRDQFIQRMEDSVIEFYGLLALLGRGVDLSDQDRDDLGAFTLETLERLEDFNSVLGLGTASTAYILWRSLLYGNARNVFIWFTLPRDLALGLPLIPGIDCLGNGACGCRLEWEVTGENSIGVYWILNPVKDHCEVCVGAASEWNPLEIEL